MSGPNYNINWEGLSIPKLKIGIGTDNEYLANDIIVSLDGMGNRTFLELSPRIFLFQYRPRRRPKTVITPAVIKPAGFYHPVDANAATVHGATSKWYGGSRRDHNGISLLPRNTEWPLAITKVGEKQTINDIQFERYFQVQGLLINPRRDLLLSDFPLAPTDRTYNRGSHWSSGAKIYARNLIMKFAIGVKNPDPKTGENPWIMGPMSDTIITRIDRRNRSRFISRVGKTNLGGY